VLEKLKPCPFCRGEAKLVDVGIEGEFQDWAVECPNCHIALLYHDYGWTILEAVTAWNRRAESDL
jgi:hypothetical protein